MSQSDLGYSCILFLSPFPPPFFPPVFCVTAGANTLTTKGDGYHSKEGIYYKLAVEATPYLLARIDISEKNISWPVICLFFFLIVLTEFVVKNLTREIQTQTSSLQN